MKVKLDEGATMPYKKRDTDAGYDLTSNESATIEQHGSVVIDTGIHIAIPEGHFGLVCNRSGLNIKAMVTTGLGIIDCGYTGSIKIRLYNHSNIAYDIQRGDRVSQLVLVPCGNHKLIQVAELPETDRSDKGFGSSGR